MAEAIIEDPPPTPDSNSTFPPSDFDSTSFPPFDQFFHSSSNQISIGELMSDLGFPVDGDGDFELTFDGVDDLYFPFENEPFLINASKQEQIGDFTPESEGSDISGDCVPRLPSTLKSVVMPEEDLIELKFRLYSLKSRRKLSLNGQRFNGLRVQGIYVGNAEVPNQSHSKWVFKKFMELDVVNLTRFSVHLGSLTNLQET